MEKLKEEVKSACDDPQFLLFLFLLLKDKKIIPDNVILEWTE